LRKLPAETIISAVEAVTHRTPAKINSFRYFVQELVALPDSGNRAWRKKQLEKIVRRIRENAVGRTDYSAGDLVEDVKRACAREAVAFDNDIFDELAGQDQVFWI
jgi:GTP cyclohydrolase FolE2